MAGDWIKMRSNLWDDPRVSGLCDMTGAIEATVIGGLYWLWATADQHSESGVLPGLTTRAIDRKTGVAGLGEALVSIGWLQVEPLGVVLIRFDEHNGATAKKRAVTAKRVANHRGNAPVAPGALPAEQPGEQEPPPSEQDVTQAALQDEHDGVTEALAREREEEEQNKTSGSNTHTGDSEAPPAHTPTSVGLIARTLRMNGIDCGPADPRIVALAEQCVSLEALRDAAKAAKTAKGAGATLGYVLGILKRWAEEASALRVSGARAPAANKAQAVDDSNRAAVDEAVRIVAARRGSGRTIDMEEGYAH